MKGEGNADTSWVDLVLVQISVLSELDGETMRIGVWLAFSI